MEFFLHKTLHIKRQGDNAKFVNWILKFDKEGQADR